MTEDLSRSMFAQACALARVTDTAEEAIIAVKVGTNRTEEPFSCLLLLVSNICFLKRMCMRDLVKRCHSAHHVCLAAK